MKFLIQSLLAFSFSAMLISSGCNKGGDDGGGGGGTTEANLVVTTNPAVGSNLPASVGPFDLSVTITSAMPSGGVKIEVSAKKDDGTNPPAYYTQTISSTASATSNFSITNSPAASLCIVDIKVTSLSKPTNTWSGSYRYTRK